MERLRSGLSAWRSAESAAAEAAEKLGTAKSDRDSKTESFREAVDEIPADADPTEEQEHRIASLAKDLRRSEQKFTECDREKRSRADHEKKVGARFLKVAMEIAEGQGDLYSQQVSDGDAWRGVPIADIVGDLQAQQFVKQGFHSLADLCDGYKRAVELVRSGDITRQGLDFVGQQVASAMHSRGYAKHLPEPMMRMVGKTVKAPPDVKPEKAEKPESDSEG